MPTRTTKLSEVIGGRSAKAIDKALGLTTVGELIRHYPRRFNERGELTDLSELVEGDEVTVQAADRVGQPAPDSRPQAHHPRGGDRAPAGTGPR